jgi:TolA-binding protein
MDRQHRHDLKHDRFIDEIGDLSQRARANQRTLLAIAGAAIAIALIVWGIFFYRSTQEAKAQALLATAIQTIESPLRPEPGQPPVEGAKFKTEAERNTAAEKQFRDVMSQYSGSDAADVASLYLARLDAANGKSDSARALLTKFIDEHDDNVLVGSARFSLYQLRLEGNEAAQVVTELNAELAKDEPVLPADSILVLLAHAYDVQGNAEKARESYRRIITEHPDSPFVLEAQRRVGAQG